MTAKLKTDFAIDQRLHNVKWCMHIVLLCKRIGDCPYRGNSITQYSCPRSYLNHHNSEKSKLTTQNLYPRSDLKHQNSEKFKLNTQHWYLRSYNISNIQWSRPACQAPLTRGYPSQAFRTLSFITQVCCPPFERPLECK